MPSISAARSAKQAATGSSAAAAPSGREQPVALEPGEPGHAGEEQDAREPARERPVEERSGGRRHGAARQPSAGRVFSTLGRLRTSSHQRRRFGVAWSSFSPSGVWRT